MQKNNNKHIPNTSPNRYISRCGVRYNCSGAGAAGAAATTTTTTTTTTNIEGFFSRSKRFTT